MRHLKWVGFLGLCLLTSPVHAFQILSAATNACHENITLGTVGEGPAEFRYATPGNALLQRLVSRVRSIGVPGDAQTRAFINEVSSRFHWRDFDLEARYVLSSMVAGARMPDTAGFSIIDINHIRGAQLTDEAQAIHTLRRVGDNGDPGDQSAISHTRSLISSLVNGILSGWSSGSLIREQLWTFPFYGEHHVRLFSPAFDIGQMFHSIEDSYSHTIRDQSFNILGVANYIETMNKVLDKDRDGPAHSERLDQCNMANDFDAMRITEAQRQMVRVLNEIDSLLGAGTTSDATVETILDDVYAYRSGCNQANGYCGVPWAVIANEDVSKPYNLMPGCGRVAGSAPTNTGGGGEFLVIAVLFIPIFLALKLRRSPGSIFSLK